MEKVSYAPVVTPSASNLHLSCDYYYFFSLEAFTSFLHFSQAHFTSAVHFVSLTTSLFMIFHLY